MKKNLQFVAQYEADEKNQTDAGTDKRDGVAIAERCLGSTVRGQQLLAGQVVSIYRPRD